METFSTTLIASISLPTYTDVTGSANDIISIYVDASSKSIFAPLETLSQVLTFDELEFAEQILGRKLSYWLHLSIHHPPPPPSVS